MPDWVAGLPAVNASLNALATVLLLTGYVLIKRGRREAHACAMISAFGTSVVFLVCYLVYHAALHHYTGESGKKFVDRTGAVVTDIAYLNISQFHDRTVSELKTKLKDVEGKYKGLVLDLRGNPGGLLSATVEVADEFLNSGVVLSELDANGKTRSWSAKSGGLATKIPIVILMDKGSASGSEVLAGALRDNGRATIVGTRSFGKGTVNQLQPLKKCGDPAGCGALYLAVGRWLSPNGEQIEGVGIKPDLELPMTRDEYIDRGDIQVFKAIDILHGK